MGCLLAVLCEQGLVAAPATNFFQAPSTRRMAERLQRIADEIHPENNVWFCAERVAKYGPLIPAIKDTPTLLKILPSFGMDQLNAGQTEEAIRTFDRVEQLAKKDVPSFWGEPEAEASNSPGSGFPPFRRTGELFEQSHDGLVFAPDPRGRDSQTPAGLAGRHSGLHGSLAGIPRRSQVSMAVEHCLHDRG